MVGIRACAKTHDFGVNGCAAPFGVFQLFQHQHPRTFAHHETVAVFVPRTGSGGGVVVAGGQGFHGGKSADAQCAHRAFCAARNHHIGIAVLNDAHGIADGVRAGGARGYHAVAGAAIAFEDGNVPRNQVNQRAGDEKGVDFACAACGNGVGGGFNGGQTTDARTNVYAHAVFIQLGKLVQTGISDGLHRTCDAVVDKGIHATGFFGGDVLGYIKIFHFACNLAGNVASVKSGDFADAAFACQQVLPRAGHVIAHGRYLS